VSLKPHRVTPIERFHDAVHFEQNTGCWLWAGPTSGKYGCICVGGKGQYAHRYSYTIHKGRIPPGICICHRCDTPLCVNPDHLFKGTQSDNILDAVRKGRFIPPRTPGSKYGNSKLSIETVRRIRLDPRSSAALARELNVSASAVVQARAGATWPEAAPPMMHPRLRACMIFIQRELAERGKTPALRAIAAAGGASAPSVGRRAIRLLLESGYLRRLPNGALEVQRSIPDEERDAA